MANDFVDAAPSDEKDEMLDEELKNLSIVERLKKAPVKTVHAIVEECEQAMNSRMHDWERYRQKYRRGLRYGGQRSNSNPLYPTNYVYNVIETLKANVVSGMSNVVAIPVEEGDAVAAEVFGKIVGKALKSAKLKEKSREVVHHGGITGMAWLKVAYDPDLFYGKGDVYLEVIAPEDILMLGSAVQYEYLDLIVHRRRDVSEFELKAEYDLDYIKGSPSDKKEDRSTGGGKRNSTLFKTYSVYEVWALDYTTHTWWITTVAGSTVLKECHKSAYEHNKHVFVPWFDVADTGADQAYCVGVGEVEEIEALQDLADALDIRIYKNVKQITSRQRVLNPASGISKEDVDDTPNRIYECNGDPRNAMLWDNPPALGQDVYTYREKIEDRIQTVTGIFEVTQGQKPSGIQAARAIGALQEAGAKRLKAKQESLLATQSIVATLAAHTIKQFYTEERIVRISGEKSFKIVGDYPESILNPEAVMSMEESPLDQMGEMLAGGVSPEEGMMPEEGIPEELSVEAEDTDEMRDTDIEMAKAQWREENGIDLVMSDIDFNYDIVFTTDSALPESRAERSQLVVDMFRLGAIDRKALLEGLDYPDREAILRRLSAATTGQTPPDMNEDNAEAVAAQQQQEMLMQSMEQGMGGGVPEEDVPEDVLM